MSQDTVTVNVGNLEAMADNIADISRAVKRLLAVYERRAIIALIREYCNTSKENIGVVLHTLEALESRVKPPAKKEKK